MNCNKYFFINTQKGYSQYPDNYTKAVIFNILVKTDRKQNVSQFAISIKGKLVYVIYQYRYTDNKYFGICCEFNNVVPTNFAYLFEFYDKLIVDILKKGELLHYDSDGTINSSVDSISDKVELLNLYSNYIDKYFDEKLADFINLPPQNYTSSKKNIIMVEYDKISSQLKALLNSYDSILVTRDNPFVLGYANTLKKSSEKISELEVKLAKINRQKKQYRIVVILGLVVVACFVALDSFNANIQSLTGDLMAQSKEIDALNQDLTFAHEKIDTMSNNLVLKNSEIKMLEQKVLTDESLIDSLVNAIKIQETQITDLKGDLSTVNDNLSSTRVQLSNEKTNHEDTKQKLSNFRSKIEKTLPLIVNRIEIASSDKKGEKLVSDYGQAIYSNKAKWLLFKINYDVISSGYKKFYFKIYNQKDELIKSSSSPSGYSSSAEVYISSYSNNVVLFGWGDDKIGYWRKGNHRVEIWYQDMCIKAKSFTIY